MAAAKGTGLILKSVKSIAVRMCPFEPNMAATRKFLEVINSKKVRSTNNNCEITVDVRHDKSEPSIDILFSDGERLLINSGYVTCNEMLLKLGHLCSEKDNQKKDTTNK